MWLGLSSFAVSTVLIFTMGIQNFSNENEAIGIFGVFPEICSSCIVPIEHF